MEGFSYDRKSILEKYDSTPTANSTNLVESGAIKNYVDTEVDFVDAKVDAMIDRVGNPFTFKGTVSTLSNLPSTGNTTNDTYFVEAEGFMYTWNGSSFTKSSSDVNNQLARDIATEYSTTKSNYKKGDFVLYNNQTYVRKEDATGAEGTFVTANWTAVSIADHLVTFKGEVEDDLTNLKSAIGNKSNLNTDTKTNLVSAINEVNGHFLDGIEEGVADWLDDHPEATTTVEDGSLTENKFSNELVLKAINSYVIPEMYGAKGDGITDDTQSLQDAIDSGKPVYLIPSKVYLVDKIYVSNNRLNLNGATINGTISVNLNGIVENGIVTGSPSIVIESTQSNKGYTNASVKNMRLVPGSGGVGIYIYSDVNPLFGFSAENIDISSCLDSISIYSNRWVTKGRLENIYCHTPTNSVIRAENQNTNVSDLADIIISNVYGQYDDSKPSYFLDNPEGKIALTFVNSFVYDGIGTYHFNIASNSETRITLIGDYKSSSEGEKFTNGTSLRAFFFDTHHGSSVGYQKVDNISVPPYDYYGSITSAYSSSKATVGGKFLGFLARLGASAGTGSSFKNKIFGITFYDGRLGVVRGTDGTTNNLSAYEVSTPYSGAVYTTQTLPSGALDGATCFCSDILMAVTKYNGTWYKPDGTALT